MSYHLNIVEATNPDRRRRLSEVLALLREVDRTASVIDSESRPKALSAPNLYVGELFFSNGMLWSVYESDDQVKRLIEFLGPFGMVVIGEEGERYTIDPNSLKVVSERVSSKKNNTARVKRWFDQRKFGLLLLVVFSVVTWVIS